ncbi:MAG: TonB-dependent receptor [Sphingomonas bacterium]|uniref:TonB-dependent receptor n=1 Tax=Sphingomonas bacterium TaxID=1895847 RepID=UPI0026214462|nr:TonB-dependent receptor [Sphingomonas bacterium]MDB5703407.1 TonB-dependent receptor [Sphingomonas bacterium]
MSDVSRKGGIANGSLGVALKGGVSVFALCTVSIASPAWALESAPKIMDSAQPASDGQASNTQTPSNAPAQTQEVDEADIVVTGIRQSLKTAQALKQNAEIVSDSISSEDIGALPDRSVTEALQRVPGVAISRFAAGVDPDHFSVEGSGVVVRGLTYTRSELNGRDTFTANNGRGLSFADVPSELLSGVDVFKSPSADMVEGGIAGTVNLRTRVPFDSKGLLVAGTLEVNYGDFIHKSSPTVSILASDRWQTGIGEFGLMGSFVRSELLTRSDGLQISNWGQRTRHADGTFGQPPAGAGDTIVYIPRGAAMRTQEFDRIRYGYSAAAQWRSNDESMTATFQFLRSDSRETWTEHAVEIATDNVTSNGDSQPLPGTSFSFDSQNIFTGGTITAPNGYRADQWGDASNVRTPINGLQSNNITRAVDQRFLTDDYGANFKWKVTDRLGVNLDYQHTKSHVRNLDYGIWTSTFQNASIAMHGDDPATVNFLPVTNAGGTLYMNPQHPSFIDPYNSYYRSAMDHIEDSDGNEDAARIDLDYSFPEDSWLSSIRAGYRFSDRENTARFSTYNWGVLSEIWGGTGPVWLDDPVNGNPNTAGGSPGPSEVYSFPDFFRGTTNLPTGPGRLFVPDELVRNYAAAGAAALAIGDEWRDRLANGCPQNWVPLAQRCGVVAGTPFLPGEINPVHERNNAVYGEIRFGNPIGDGGVRLSGNVGLRYSTTTREASGFFSFPQRSYTCTPPQNGQPPTPFCALGPTVLANANAFANGALRPISTKIDYHYYLPSLNLKLEVGGGLQFRAAFNEGVAPPDFGLTRAFYNVILDTNDTTIANNGAPIAIFNVGNPYLKPIRSDNYDLTAEWYFSSVGQLTLSLFKKDLYGVLSNGTQRLSFTNNGATFGALVTTPFNSPDTGRVKGLEIGYQQTFTFLPGFLSGFGLSGNFTYVDSKGVKQSTLSGTDPDVAAGRIANVDTSRLPLQGLSKYTLNIAPFYQAGGFEIRGAYSWRSRYLLTVRDVIVPYAPVYNEATGQFDASIFYNVTPNLKMGFQGVNLLNETLETTQVINNNLDRRPRSWFMSDRRIIFSLRAKFGG